LLTFDLNASNNFQAQVQLVRPYKAKCIKILGSQIAKISIDGVSLSNYEFNPSAEPFPFTKSNQIMTATHDPIFYFIENANTYINLIKVALIEPDQLVGTSINITIYFFDFIPSLIAE